MVVTEARARADSELAKALAALDPNDFSSNVKPFRDFIHSVAQLFFVEMSELRLPDTEAGLRVLVYERRQQILDEYTKAPSRKRLSKRARKLLGRPLSIDERISIVPLDKWDGLTPRPLLPNKKQAVRRELRRVLGEQTAYWFAQGFADARQRTDATRVVPSPGGHQSTATELSSIARTQPSPEEVPTTTSYDDQVRASIERLGNRRRELMAETEAFRAMYGRDPVPGELLEPPIEGASIVGHHGIPSSESFGSHGQVTVSGTDDSVSERAAKRLAVVGPILKDKLWTRGRLATEAGVGKNSIYQYLNGNRAKITDANRKAIAQALSLIPDKLPD